MALQLKEKKEYKKAIERIEKSVEFADALARIGIEKLLFVSDGIDAEMQTHIGVNPVLGEGDAAARAQRTIDQFAAAHPDAAIAVIPEGPYTMLRVRP